MVRAKLSNLRIAPRKMRLIVDLIRRKPVLEAERILKFAVKSGVKDILKLLKSAVSSASHDFQLEESNLYIAKITVDEGPKLKRWMPRARGSASAIQKKTSHITIILEEIEKGKTAAVKTEVKAEKEAIVKTEKPKFELEKEAPKPKVEKGLKRIFRRKAF
jgi:large subunit ribosomal protein L22